MDISKQILKELKRAHNNAVKNSLNSFNFKGNELLTSYAKYLIEYLEGLKLK